MSSHNYSINSSRPAFSVADDDMEAAFLQSSGGSYLGSNHVSNNSPDLQYQTTIQQIQDVETRTLDSTKRSLQAIAESEQVGVETAKDLVHQREQLENTNKRLDNINQDLKESQKNINAIKSVFSSFRQWMSSPKVGTDAKSKPGTSSNDDPIAYKEPNFDHNPKLEKAVNIAPSCPDPSLRIRDVDYNEGKTSSRYEGPAMGSTDNWRDTTSRVNRQLDNDLEEMSFGLSRLRGLAEGLGQEITEQNVLLDAMGNKAEATGSKLTCTNKQINSLLKK